METAFCNSERELTFELLDHHLVGSKSVVKDNRGDLCLVGGGSKAAIRIKDILFRFFINIFHPFRHILGGPKPPGPLLVQFSPRRHSVNRHVQ